MRRAGGRVAVRRRVRAAGAFRFLPTGLVSLPAARAVVATRSYAKRSPRPHGRSACGVLQRIPGARGHEPGGRLAALVVQVAPFLTALVHDWRRGALLPFFRDGRACWSIASCRPRSSSARDRRRHQPVRLCEHRDLAPCRGVIAPGYALTFARSPGRWIAPLPDCSRHRSPAAFAACASGATRSCARCIGWRYCSPGSRAC